MKIFTGTPEYFRKKMLERRKEEFEFNQWMEEKIFRMFTPNNRLKMLGKPMKRRGV